MNMLKNFLATALTLLLPLLLAILPTARADAHRDGNGSDNVEVLFFQAQDKAIKYLNLLDPRVVEEPYHAWLTPARLVAMRAAAEKMVLKFQEQPCIGMLRDEKVERGACYQMSASGEMFVTISRTYNKFTTLGQAIAMLIHEAGHFAGEDNHEFLSAFGAEVLRKTFYQQSLPPQSDSIEYLCTGPSELGAIAAYGVATLTSYDEVSETCSESYKFFKHCVRSADMRGFMQFEIGNSKIETEVHSRSYFRSFDGLGWSQMGSGYQATSSNITLPLTVQDPQNPELKLLGIQIQRIDTIRNDDSLLNAPVGTHMMGTITYRSLKPTGPTTVPLTCSLRETAED